MKTLDEVIKGLDVCLNGKGCENCPYAVYDKDGFGEHFDCVKMQTDALHYLKHLQEYYEMSKKRHEPNMPLTWDELKQMEGKPVWVETDNVKFWTVVYNFRTICNQECLCCSKGYLCRSTHARGDWQAYRKERTE